MEQREAGGIRAADKLPVLSMKIGGLQKVSLIDYPGRMSAVVFTQGCNFRCPYCHNPELVDPALYREPIPEEDVLSFLERRRGRLDAVTITGGEPTLQKGLLSFLQRIKEMGFLSKVDTNGSYPSVLAEILDKGLADYLAMDVKGPLARYEEIINARVDAADITKSIALITGSGVAFEFRTTLAAPLLTGDDVLETAGMIPAAGRYVLQRFVPSKLLDDRFRDAVPFSDDVIHNLKSRLEKRLFRITIR
jgi:pyruvate formate lyase activating enzyme